MIQVIKSAFSFLVLCIPAAVSAQTNWMYQGTKDYILLDRMDIKMQQNKWLRFNKDRAFPGKWLVYGLEDADSLGVLTPVDRFNMQSALMSNSEWLDEVPEYAVSKKPWFNTFYKTKSNFFEVNSPDFFLVVNPAFHFRVMKEQGNNESLFLNTRGIFVRGLIAKKVSFQASITENQERGPAYMMERVRDRNAVPGVGFFKDYNTTGLDYFDARGSFSFSAAKFFDFQFGYDKNFIGNGYRSLFLSDYANSSLFLKMNLRVWKLNYQNLWMELTPQFISNPGDILLPKKYASMHHLDLQVTPWLNLGLFESIIFGRKDHFDFTYLNPIIYLRAAEHQNGSPDNAVAGFDFKANIAKHFQAYGQLMLDEFKVSEITHNQGWWANKWGVQFGAKYVDAFGVPNLDLQAETNIVRPYTYSHYDSVSSYDHYNQPLAHPLGTNFQELIAIARYQPVPRLTIEGRIINARFGLDTAGKNFGNSIFKLNDTREKDYGVTFFDAKKGTVLNANLALTYELRENVFIDVTGTIRKLNKAAASSAGLRESVVMIGAGFRMNIFKREYDY